MTLALYHAARNEPYKIRFNGKLGLSHTTDTAAAFIAPALNPRPGAHVHTMGGPIHETDEAADLIAELTGKSDLVTVEPTPLGIACETTDASYQDAYGPLAYRSLRDGFKDTLAVWSAAGVI